MSVSNSDPDSYLELGAGSETEIKVKGSRFLGQAFSATDPEELEARLRSVRKRYHDATHHCWAWRSADPDAPQERFDDDGEPSGTAGPPILAAIKRTEATGGLVVVTRYYGGTKLGTGGLVRAYGESATAALAAAVLNERFRVMFLALTFAYDDLGTVERLLARAADAVLTVDRRFDPAPRIELELKRSRVQDFEAELVEASAGRVRVTRGG